MFSRIYKAFSLLLLFGVVACSTEPVNRPVEQFNPLAFEAEGAKQFYSWTSDRIPLISAHRGGPYNGFPENAIETFNHVLGYTPAIIECDVAMTSDSVLVMMHDNSIDRTTNGSGLVKEMTWDELSSYRLKDNKGQLTDFLVPTLEDVLKVMHGRALLTLDIKRGVPLKMVVDLVESTEMEEFAAIITYNANAAKQVYELNNNLMISVGISNSTAYEAHKVLGIPDENMIAFVGVSEPELEIYDFLHDKGIYAILGVLGNLDRSAVKKGDSLYAKFVERGADILATDRPIEASKAVYGLIPSNSSKSNFFIK